MTKESDANDAIRAAVDALKNAIDMSERVVYGSQVLVPLRDALRGVLSRNRRKFRQPINVACPAPGRWGRPNSRVTSRHFDHGNASRTSRPDCSGLDEAD